MSKLLRPIKTLIIKIGRSRLYHWFIILSVISIIFIQLPTTYYNLGITSAIRSLFIDAIVFGIIYLPVSYSKKTTENEC